MLKRRPEPADVVLFVAVDLPPFEAFERGHFFRAMFLIYLNRRTGLYYAFQLRAQEGEGAGIVILY